MQLRKRPSSLSYMSAPKKRKVTKDSSTQDQNLQWDSSIISFLRSHGALKSTHEKKQIAMLAAPSAPHPGFIGDGELPAENCISCRLIKTHQNAIICDECLKSFHVSCYMSKHYTPKQHFKDHDFWFCHNCRSNHSNKMQVSRSCSVISTTDVQIDSNSSSKDTLLSKVCKVALGPSHQAEVPLWQGPIKPKDDETRCIPGCIGMESAFSQREKNRECKLIVDEYFNQMFKKKSTFYNYINSQNPLPVDPFDQNWVKCNNVVVKAFIDTNGFKHGEIVCGKWRRAPPHVQQSDDWECFCAMEWDPEHADCAIPQELPTEQIPSIMHLQAGKSLNNSSQAR